MRPVYIENSGGVIHRHDDPGDVLATTWWGNPLRAGDDGIPDGKASWLVTWSGTLADGLWDAHPATWLSPGHQALESFCERMTPRLEAAGRRLCFRPHARHVLNDTPGCESFLRGHEGQAVSVAMSPAGTLEATMLGEIDDHLRRAFELLGDRVPMAILHDVSPEEAPGGLTAVPLGDGCLPRDVVRGLIDEHLPKTTPIILRGERIDEQLAWLGP